MNPDNDAYQNQSHCGHRHHAIIKILAVDNLETQQRTASEELTHSTHDD